MVSEKLSGDDAVIHYVKKAIDIGAMGLEVEYESGREHIFAIGEHSGVEIASLESRGKQARALREALCQISEQPRKVVISGSGYALTVQVDESFGEDVYRVTFKKA
jgi:hypothetical protein